MTLLALDLRIPGGLPLHDVRAQLIPRLVDRRLLRTYAMMIWFAEIYVILVDAVIVQYRPAWILPAVAAGFTYGYISVLVLHSRFVTEHERVRAARAAALSDEQL